MVAVAEGEPACVDEESSDVGEVGAEEALASSTVVTEAHRQSVADALC